MNELQNFEKKLEQYKEIVSKLEYKNYSIRFYYKFFKEYVMYLRYTNKTVKRNKHIKMLKILEKSFDTKLSL